MAFSVSLGLTNACNLRCPHCYRPEAGLDQLTLEEVTQVCESIPVQSLNLGVGENGLHPDFHAILDRLGLRISETLPDHSVTLEETDCLFRCSMAPLVEVYRYEDQTGMSLLFGLTGLPGLIPRASTASISFLKRSLPNTRHRLCLRFFLLTRNLEKSEHKLKQEANVR